MVGPLGSIGTSRSIGHEGLGLGTFALGRGGLLGLPHGVGEGLPAFDAGFELGQPGAKLFCLGVEGLELSFGFLLVTFHKRASLAVGIVRGDLDVDSGLRPLGQPRFRPFDRLERERTPGGSPGNPGRRGAEPSWPGRC